MTEAASAELLGRAVPVVEVLLAGIADDGSSRTLAVVVVHEMAAPETCTCRHHMMLELASLHRKQQYIPVESALLHIVAQQNLAVAAAEGLGQID